MSRLVLVDMKVLLWRLVLVAWARLSVEELEESRTNDAYCERPAMWRGLIALMGFLPLDWAMVEAASPLRRARFEIAM
jgi:hypothetical protein